MIYVPLKENTVALCPSAALEPYKGTDALCKKCVNAWKDR